MSIEHLRQRILSSVPVPKTPSVYRDWKLIVAAKYTDVFFPPLSPVKNKILKNVVAAITASGVDYKEFFEWLVVNWKYMDKLSAIEDFKKYYYPEIDLVLRHYAKLLNLYKGQLKGHRPTIR